jgi:hypothetical protein
VADLGSLQLSNSVAWLGAAGRTPKEVAEDSSVVLLDTTMLTMRGLSAKVDAGGHSGGNIIREYDEGTKVRGLGLLGVTCGFELPCTGGAVDMQASVVLVLVFTLHSYDVSSCRWS